MIKTGSTYKFEPTKDYMETVYDVTGPLGVDEVEGLRGAEVQVKALEEQRTYLFDTETVTTLIMVGGPAERYPYATGEEIPFLVTVDCLQPIPRRYHVDVEITLTDDDYMDDATLAMYVASQLMAGPLELEATAEAYEDEDESNLGDRRAYEVETLD